MKILGFNVTKTKPDTPTPVFMVPTTPAYLVAPIQVRDIPEDLPEFEREYKVSLPDRRTMTVTIKRLFGNFISMSGELRQADGRHVWFEPTRVADHILDPTLAPLVENYCRMIIVEDKAWRDLNPAQFSDKRGRLWQLMK